MTCAQCAAVTAAAAVARTCDPTGDLQSERNVTASRSANGTVSSLRVQFARAGPATQPLLAFRLPARWCSFNGTAGDIRGGRITGQRIEGNAEVE